MLYTSRNVSLPSVSARDAASLSVDEMSCDMWMRILGRMSVSRSSRSTPEEINQKSEIRK